MAAESARLEDRQMKIDGLHIKPHISVDMEENSLIILGVCRRALRQLDIAEAEIRRFKQEAMSDDREHLIAVVQSVFETG